MANGTIAFDTLTTSGQIDGTARSIDTDYLLNGSAKVWSNYVTASSFSINDSFNYASITDSGAGFATHNFTNAFANSLFSYVGLAEVSSADAVTVIGYTTNKTTTTCRQVSYNSSNSATDQPGNSFSAHGELA
tara:strand:+ start:328 stop:726 length:399 start_codon:yes stop_codon:yes gene_type:complete